jgi:hypothetical protein
MTRRVNSLEPGQKPTICSRSYFGSHIVLFRVSTSGVISRHEHRAGGARRPGRGPASDMEAENWVSTPGLTGLRSPTPRNLSDKQTPLLHTPGESQGRNRVHPSAGRRNPAPRQAIHHPPPYSLRSWATPIPAWCTVGDHGTSGSCLRHGRRIGAGRDVTDPAKGAATATPRSICASTI